LPTVKALVVADEESKYIWDHFDRSVFAGVDVIISCGDLKASYLSFLTTMVAAPLLYVPGNHDSKYLLHPPEGCDDLTEKMHVIKGVRFVGFGGCQSMSPKPFHYTEGEVVKQVAGRMSEIARHGGFDVLVTHAPAAGLGDGTDAFHRGFIAYRLLLDQFRPAFHFHGHQHTTYGGAKTRIKYDNTVIINAYGYQIVDITVPERKPGRTSYIKMRYEWRVRNGRK
jgi:predicted phosphodiesterase